MTLNTPKIRNGLILPKRVGKAIQLKLVKKNIVVIENTFITVIFRHFSTITKPLNIGKGLNKHRKYDKWI